MSPALSLWRHTLCTYHHSILSSPQAQGPCKCKLHFLFLDSRRIPLFQVDAFTDELFKGNPAAVCVTDQWLDDALMQNIAAENNLAETAFLVPAGNDFSIRWFTPETEVDLCGHATLAAGYVLFHQYGFPGDTIHLHSKNSGLLKVTRDRDLFILDFAGGNPA